MKSVKRIKKTQLFAKWEPQLVCLTFGKYSISTLKFYKLDQNWGPLNAHKLQWGQSHLPKSGVYSTTKQFYSTFNCLSIAFLCIFWLILKKHFNQIHVRFMTIKNMDYYITFMVKPLYLTLKHCRGISTQGRRRRSTDRDRQTSK